MTCLTLYMIRNPVCTSVSYKVDIQTSFWYNSCNFDYLFLKLGKIVSMCNYETCHYAINLVIGFCLVVCDSLITFKLYFFWKYENVHLWQSDATDIFTRRKCPCFFNDRFHSYTWIPFSLVSRKDNQNHMNYIRRKSECRPCSLQKYTRDF